MPKRLRAGLVGCGSLSQRGILPHLSQPDAREKIELVAVTDNVPERAEKCAEEWGIPQHFSDLDGMLREADLDLVLVITPIPLHSPQALAAVEVGKHVYVQKAMTVTVEEADALLAARDHMGVKLAAAPGYELFTMTAQLREAARREIGAVYLAYSYTLGFGHEREGIRQEEGAQKAIDPGWYYRAGAGPLPDVTVYSLQLLTSVLGPVRRVTAMANTLRPDRTWRGQPLTLEEPDNNVVLMEFVTGAMAVAVGSDCRGSSQFPWGGFELFGSAGTLELNDVEPNSGYPVQFRVHSREGRTATADLTASPYLRGEHLKIEEPHVFVDIMDLADAILEDRPPRATGEQARHVVEIIERARAAIRTGRTQELRTTFEPQG